MKVISIAAAKTADLVKFYNDFADTINFTPVKKFADRATAEKRLVHFSEALGNKNDDFADLAPGYIPAPEGHEGEVFFSKNGEIVTEEEYNAEESPESAEEPEVAASTPASNSFAQLVATAEKIRSEHEASGEPVIKQNTGTKASNSEGVAASWVDAEVRAARLERHGVKVEVGGVEVGIYKSTRDAFRANRLPDNKHIRFRLKLKEAFRDKGQGATFEHGSKKFHFTIVDLPEPEEKEPKKASKAGK